MLQPFDEDPRTTISFDSDGCAVKQCTFNGGLPHGTHFRSILVTYSLGKGIGFAPELVHDSVKAQVYGLTTIDGTNPIFGHYDSPCAFMNFPSSDSTKHPVIFDTGASLAITNVQSNFDGPLPVPKGDLCLGGMANRLQIEGVGPVTWTFANGSNASVCLRGMAYCVPQAKARLLSPQHLFDGTTGLQGYNQEDHQSFRLLVAGMEPLVIKFDDRNSLPIGYATIGPAPLTPLALQVNLSLMDPEN